jgi:uncharacterized protein YciI
MTAEYMMADQATAGRRSAHLSGDSPVARSARLPLWLLHWTPTVPPERLEPLLTEHLRYMIDLEARGLLFASGPLAEPDGSTSGAGLTALCVPLEADARALADDDPFARHGLRSYTLQRWTLIEGNLSTSVRLSDSSVAFAAAGKT